MDEPALFRPELPLLYATLWHPHPEPDQVRQFTDQLLADCQHDRHYLVQLLVRLQLRFGFIPPPALNRLSETLSISIGELQGVIDFYWFLESTFGGQYQISLARNITDEYLGCVTLTEELCRLLKCEPGSVREDGRVRVSFTACTGLCDQGPAALVNGFPLVHLDRQRVEQITALVESQTPLSDWPGEWFEVDEPVWQRGLLLDAPQASGEALQAVVAAGADGFLTQLEQSGLRGRGGAGFSTWEKLWRSCREASGQHYVVCNADEGEPGTFKDRLLLDHHADAVLEGMTIAGYVLGARKGLIYLRYEYAFLHAQLQAQLDQRRRQQLLGRSILGMEGFDFDIEIHLGAGAYVCGEESALIESLEGKRGVPRIRPPFPVTCGYRNQPTLVNNVETFACVEWIARQGGEAFAAEGTASSAGHKLHSISGDCRQPGIYELPWGCTLRELLAACGGENAAYVQVGGPSGTLVDASQFDRRLEFDDLATGGSLMVIGSERNLFELLHNFARFFHHESCGFCVPCRAGCQELRQIATQLVEQRALPKDLERIRALDLTLGASHCGLGRTATRPLAQALVLAEPLFRQQLGQADQPAFDLAAATAEARHLRKPS